VFTDVQTLDFFFKADADTNCFLRMNHTRADDAATNAPTAIIPIISAPSSEKPPPKNKPLTVERLVTPSCAKSPTQSVPKHRTPGVRKLRRLGRQPLSGQRILLRIQR